MTPAAIAHVEAVLDVLRRAGFSVDDAVSALQVLTAFVVGHTVAAYAPRRPDEDSHPAYDGLAAEQFPRVREAARLLLTHDLEEEFEFGLDAMFAGLEARLARPRRSKIAPERSQELAPAAATTPEDRRQTCCASAQRPRDLGQRIGS